MWEGYREQRSSVQDSRRIRSCHQSLHPALEFRAREHHLAVARKAANANIGAYPNDAPRIAAAGMLFSHLHRITNGKW